MPERIAAILYGYFHSSIIIIIIFIIIIIIVLEEVFSIVIVFHRPRLPHHSHHSRLSFGIGIFFASYRKQWISDKASRLQFRALGEGEG